MLRQSSWVPFLCCNIFIMYYLPHQSQIIIQNKTYNKKDLKTVIQSGNFYFIMKFNMLSKRYIIIYNRYDHGNQSSFSLIILILNLINVNIISCSWPMRTIAICLKSHLQLNHISEALFYYLIYLINKFKSIWNKINSVSMDVSINFQ